MRFVLLLAFSCGSTLVGLAAPVPNDGPPRVVAVSSNKDGNYWQIYLVQVDTGETKQLSDNKGDDLAPVWSPGGTRLAFISYREGGQDVWTMKADGTDLRRLTKIPGGCLNPKWSPDGSRIAFTAAKNGRTQIHTVEIGTGQAAQLTDETAWCTTPEWSPDGKKLSYRFCQGERHATYIMTADGKTKTKLNDELGGTEAVWSPDGARLAFLTFNPKTGGGRVCSIGADGKNQVRFPKDVDDRCVFPQWSPSGDRIAFCVTVAGAPQVGVMRADGGGAHVITSTHQHSHVRWSPDGKSLSYIRVETGKDAALVVCDPDGRNAKELLPGASGRADWKPK